ncbi:MAG: lipopolysaccharide heptosyltransferase II [Nitrospinota bacterium]
MTPSYRRICILKPSSLGDVIHALPVLAALRRTYPTAFISWVVVPAHASLLVDHPELDEVLLFDRAAWGRLPRLPRSIVEVASFVRALRQRRFELVVDLQGLLRSGLMALATGAPERVGFASGREQAPLFYTRRVAVPDGPRHAVDRYMLVAEAVTGQSHPVTFPLGLAADDYEEADRFLAGAGLGPHQPVVVLSPGASWSSKRWAPEQFAALAAELRSRLGLAPVLVGGPGEEVVVGVVRRAMGQATPAAFFPSLRVVAALFARARLAVTNDSGAMHLAAAAGCPVVALFGPTDPRLTGPYGATHHVVRHAVPCSPCFLKTCPIGHDCLVGVSVEAVVAAVETVLAARTATGEVRT